MSSPDVRAERNAARVCAIVPAAGRSRRMGSPKPAMLVRGQPMLHRVATALLDGGIDGIVLVVNDEVRALAAPLADRCEIVVNGRPDAEMIESIQLALLHVQSARAAIRPGGYLVCPVDVGDLAAETVRACLAVFREDPSRIVIAARAGTRGHPIVFPQVMAGEVLGFPPGEGLNRLPQRHARDVVEVVCTDEAVTANINSPADCQPGAGP